MVNSCCAYGCFNRFQKDGKIKLYRFPTSRPIIYKKWIAAVRRQPTKYSCICSEHFRPEDFQPKLIGEKNRRLRCDAVPSIFNFPPDVMDSIREQKLLQRQTSEKPADEDRPTEETSVSERLVSTMNCGETVTNPVIVKLVGV